MEWYSISSGRLHQTELTSGPTMRWQWPACSVILRHCLPGNAQHGMMASFPGSCLCTTSSGHPGSSFMLHSRLFPACNMSAISQQLVLWADRPLRRWWMVSTRLAICTYPSCISVLRTSCHRQAACCGVVRSAQSMYTPSTGAALGGNILDGKKQTFVQSCQGCPLGSWSSSCLLTAGSLASMA